MTDIILPGQNPTVIVQPGQNPMLKAVAKRRLTARTSDGQMTVSVKSNGTWVEPQPPDTEPPDPEPPVEPPPNPVPVEKVVYPTTIKGIKLAIASNDVDRIKTPTTTFHCAGAFDRQETSLWIGSNLAYAGVDMTKRTRPVIVEPITPFGTVYDFGHNDGPALAWMEGAKLITWRQFVAANSDPGDDGVIKLGGNPGLLPAHDNAMPELWVQASCRGSALPDGSGPTRAHALYIGHALGRGPYNFAFPAVRLDCGGGLACGLHWYHSAAGSPNGDHIAITGTITKAQFAALSWDPTVHDNTIDVEAVSSTRGDVSYYGDLHKSEQAPTGKPSNIRMRVVASGPHGSGYSSNWYVPEGTGLVRVPA